MVLVKAKTSQRRAFRPGTSGIPAGATPFDKGTEALALLGMDGKVYRPTGSIQDNLMAGRVTLRLGLSQTDSPRLMRTTSELVRRPLTMSEVYARVAVSGASSVSITA